VTWTVPVALEDAVWDAARRHLPPEWHGGPALTAAVVDRSRRYTSERELLGAPARPHGDLAARALFFTIADAAKVRVPLAELAGRDLDPRGARVRVLDLGAGCGAMSLGALDHLAARGVRAATFDLCDHDGEALAIAGDAVRAYAAGLGVEARVSVRRVDVGAAPPAGTGPFDLVLAGSVLNELAAADRLGVVERALAALDPAGAVIVIEPALRATARDLHEVRDQVLGRGLGHVFAPCTRRAAPCPMLADERDWCHEERPLDLPPRALRLAINTGLRDGAMKFAYLVVRRGDEPLVAAGGARRVVGEARKSKGKVELWACGDDGRVRLRLLRRDRTEGNRGVERARKGDVLVGTAGDAVGKQDVVDRVTPAGGGA
jgi:ribosomal protein RSM22 (predicted rRNA methylase)